jgi:flavin-dependent dehydrogenase
MLDAEVVVVGGGPGGSAVALRLARLGHDVLVVDRQGFPRDKVCGEGLMPTGVQELTELGMPDIGAQPFLGVGYHVRGASAEGRFPGGRFGLGVRRARLDEALADACLEEGVRREQAGLTGLGGAPGAMWVDVANRGSTRRIRARAVVGADGMHSAVRRSLGLQREARGRPRYGVRAHFLLAEGARLPDLVEVHALEGLELYLTPVGPREVNVAGLVEREMSRTLKGDVTAGFFRLVHACEGLQDVLRGAEPVGEVRLCGPLRQEATDVVADGAMLVGDAAGFLDGITGEGMSLTLIAARLASDTLSRALRAGRVDRAALAPYARAREQAGRELTRLTEIVLAGIRHRALARRVVRGLGRNPDVFERVLAVSAGTGRVMDVGLTGLVRVLA